MRTMMSRNGYAPSRMSSTLALVVGFAAFAVTSAYSQTVKIETAFSSSDTYKMRTEECNMGEPCTILDETETISVYCSEYQCLFISDEIHLSRIANRDFSYRMPNPPNSPDPYTSIRRNSVGNFHIYVKYGSNSYFGPIGEISILVH